MSQCLSAIRVFSEDPDFCCLPNNHTGVHCSGTRRGADQVLRVWDKKSSNKDFYFGTYKNGEVTGVSTSLYCDEIMSSSRGVVLPK